jgi:hypothetical protein
MSSQTSLGPNAAAPQQPSTIFSNLNTSSNNNINQLNPRNTFEDKLKLMNQGAGHNDELASPRSTF